jgi:hypothetical protein
MTFISCYCLKIFKEIYLSKRESELIDMYQQQVPQPHEGQEWTSSGNEYEAGYAGNLQQSDQLADAIARRLQVQAPSPLQIQVPMNNQNPTIVSAGMRLALAIVSVIMLVPLAGIVFGVLHEVGLIAFAIAGVILLGINFFFNNQH